MLTRRDLLRRLAGLPLAGAAAGVSAASLAASVPAGNNYTAISIPFTWLPTSSYIKGPSYGVAFDSVVTPRTSCNLRPTAEALRTGLAEAIRRAGAGRLARNDQC